MRRVEMIKDYETGKHGYFHGFFSEGDAGEGISTYAQIELNDGTIHSVPTNYFRFLDPPEEEIPSKILDALNEHKHIIQEFEKRIEKLEEDYPFNFNRVSELENVVYKKEIPKPEPMFTKEEVRRAFDRWRKYTHPIVSLEVDFLSELDRIKEGKC